MVNRLLFLAAFLVSMVVMGQEDPCPTDNSIRFNTTSTHLTIWDGEQYVPFFVKGMNLGISVPGTSPGELPATTEEYYRWFGEIKEAGFNNLRVYTLHFPRFYNALDSFNINHPNDPLYLMLGMWLEEGLPGYNQDLYFLQDTFEFNYKLAVDVIHGNGQVAPRPGKASGVYTTDISKWVMAFVMGREVYPNEVLTTNLNHPADRTYLGRYLSVTNVEPATRWVTEQMDKVLQYEMDNYGASRPISFSSWPTLDPIDHPFIPGVSYPEEDTAQIDLARIDHSNSPAGIFATFHAYPYYPPFVSAETKYQNESDEYGPNSYIGYIKELRDVHPGMPTVIGEFGTPTSWGSASFAHSGMDHGGVSPDQAGQNALRMFKNMYRNNLAGGCYFAWIDEWFKRTWITDEYDFPFEGRLLWHNIMAPEQNFGLVEYVQTNAISEPFEFYGVASPVGSVEMESSYAFLTAKCFLNQPIANGDTVWIGIDTYDRNIGESILPNGETVANRAEFALAITANDAKLYVTEAYDLYGIYFGVDNKFIYESGQQYRSVVSDGAPWKIMRWRNDELNVNAIQTVGELKVNQPSEVLNVVSVDDEAITIRLPWNMINFTNPSQRIVMHDDTATRGVRETEQSDGVALSIFYKNQRMESSNRFLWDVWNTVEGTYREVKKNSYFILRDSLKTIPNPVFGKCDYYEAKKQTTLSVSSSEGVLGNDFSLDGHSFTAQVLSQPVHGQLSLAVDGSFTYTPVDSFVGSDQFTYRLVSDGIAPADPIEVNISVLELGVFVNQAEDIAVYPNPASQTLKLEAQGTIERYELLDSQGRVVLSKEVNEETTELDVSECREGIYLITAYSGQAIMTRRIMISR